MPEIAVAEDGDAGSYEDDVGSSGQSRNVQAVPEAERGQGLSELEFRARILGAVPAFHSRRTAGCRFKSGVRWGFGKALTGGPLLEVR